MYLPACMSVGMSACISACILKALRLNAHANFAELRISQRS